MITFRIDAFHELLWLKIVISRLCKQRNVAYSLLKINKNYNCTIIYSLNQQMKPLLINLLILPDATIRSNCEKRNSFNAHSEVDQKICVLWQPSFLTSVFFYSQQVYLRQSHIMADSKIYRALPKFL